MSPTIFKKRTGLHCCLILLLTTCASGDMKQPARCLKRPQTFSETIISLASRLTNEIEEGENFIISPLSISAALAMLYVGAGGTTKSQMSNALQYNLSDNRCPDMTILEGFRDLFRSLDVENDVMSLVLANCAFIQVGYNISPNYLFRVKQYFSSEINYVDFLNEEQLSMKNINQWVSNKTKTQIKKLLNEPLDTMTLMVLANVIYFKGLWEHPFRDTWNSYFHTANGTSKIVPFMKLEEHVNYYHDDSTNYAFLELPYLGGNISMLLILPLNTHELPKFQLTSENLCNIREKLEMRNVLVGLPRVQLSYRRELSKDMAKFGMTELFSENPDLSGIREQNDLHISLMIHKAVIEIDEQGSRASAVSGIGIDSRKRPAHEATFWANHPFLFYIIDKRMETTLFVGRVANP